MKRPILIALIGYIIGILWGLYLKISIVFIIIFTIITYIAIKEIVKRHNIRIQQFESRKRYRQIKIYICAKETKKAIILVAICATISNIIINIQNKQYKEKFENISQGKFIATVVEEGKESQYYLQYKIKVKANTYLLLKIKDKTKLELGDQIQFTATLEQPQQQRNYKGFDYKEYLKTKKIYAIVTANSVKVIKHNNLNFIQNIANKISKKLQSNIRAKIREKEQADLLVSLLIGADSNLEKEIKNDFRNSSLAHILAISGMHISYIILFVNLLLSKANLSKRTSTLITIFILILFVCITGFTPSVARAVIMSCLMLGADIFYKKSDIINNIAISIFIILINNPFSIKDIGLLLSFAGTIGIITIQPQIQNRFYQKNREIALANKLTILEKIYKKIIEIIIVSMSAQICILPIMLYHFNQLSLTFFISNLFVSFLIGPIISLGFCLAIFPFPILPEIGIIFLKALSGIAKIGAKLPFSNITVITPNLSTIAVYYILVFLIYTHLWKKNIKLSTIVNKIHTFVNKKQKMLITMGTIVLIINVISIVTPKGLTIHCIDVGQGDSTLILANNQKILIDGGGSSSKEFDIGESTLVPYLLDRKIKTIDYVMVSHFDTDHVGGLLTVMNKLKVKNIIIGKQFEDSSNYQEFLRIVKEKKTKLHVVEAGQKINIEKDLYFEVLWPSSKNVISENSINNNSLVCKMVYKKYSILFTGDIEAVAEKAILEKYRNTDTLKSTILKVAHHGSKSSTTKEFVNAVKPKIALIGVGEKNKFGHPNSGVLERLKRMWK